MHSTRVFVTLEDGRLIAMSRQRAESLVEKAQLNRAGPGKYVVAGTELRVWRGRPSGGGATVMQLIPLPYGRAQRRHVEDTEETPTP